MSRGSPLIALRLPKETIAALKISARRHGLTVSDLLRQLIDEQLKQDGIQVNATPLPGQRDIDDYIMDEATST